MFEKEELTNDELDAVTGGVYNPTGNNTVEKHCEKCNKITKFKVFSGCRGVCQECNTVIFM